MNNAINTNLASLAANIDALEGVVDTYEGMLRHCWDASLLARRTEVLAEKARLEAEYNSLLYRAEAA